MSGKTDPHRLFVVDASHADQRLDVFLAARLACSRGSAQQAIERGEVRCNGQGARSSHKVRARDQIEVSFSSPPEPEKSETTGATENEETEATEGGETAESVWAAPEPIPLAVLFEDENLLVLNKPAGLVVHPAGSITSGTLANALAHRWGQQPGLVHRLDRDTSGVMVVARSQAARARLIEQFRSHTVSKEYAALVHGRVTGAPGRVEAPLRRDRKNRLKMVTCSPGEGREALTLYRVREQWAEVTLLDVEIRTGRTHQIRVHCAHLGHPVVADEMYGKGRTAHLHAAEHRAAVAALGRQFLHAARLSFDHPATGERVSFEAPLGPDLQTLLTALGPPLAPSPRR